VSETKQPWTPGEWKSSYDVVDDVAEIIAVGQGRDGCSLHIVDVDGDDAKANGIVMAAAPALAKALALFIQCLDASRDPTTNPLRLALDRDRCEKVARAALDACGWQWGGR
jgi:hypothetical protein